MPELPAVWNGDLYIGTAYSNDAWTYNKLCKGVKSFNYNPNEVVKTEHYICGEGGANTEVTGLAPVIPVTCDRVVGDTAQDYIVGLITKLGKDRKSSVKVIQDGVQIICDCTITNIVPFGGNATDLKAFSCEIHLNGIPTVSAVTP